MASLRLPTTAFDPEGQDAPPPAPARSTPPPAAAGQHGLPARGERSDAPPPYFDGRSPAVAGHQVRRP